MLIVAMQILHNDQLVSTKNLQIAIVLLKPFST